MAKPYDSKKSYWCPDGDGGFNECLLDNDDGKKATVMVGHEVSKTIIWLYLYYYMQNIALE